MTKTMKLLELKTVLNSGPGGSRTVEQDLKDESASPAGEQNHGTPQQKHEANHPGSLHQRLGPTGGVREAGCQS